MAEHSAEFTRPVPSQERPEEIPAPTRSVRTWAEAWKRFTKRRPSAAMMTSIVALFFALSGTAYAATGGTFILGKANTASSVSSLTNSKGTALRLSSLAGTAPLAVNSTVQVSNLNASLLDGSSASAFVQGSGNYQTGQLALSGTGSGSSGLIVAIDSDLLGLQGVCSSSGAETQLFNYTGQAALYGFQTQNSSTSSNTGSLPNFQTTDVGSGPGSPQFLIGQVSTGINVATLVVLATWNPTTLQCTWAAQFLSH